MFSADLGGYTAPLPAATDPPFQKVALLLHGDGTNGAQNNTFVDYSYPGGYAVSFDGSGDYLTVAPTSSLDISTGDWTVELWWNPQSTSNQYIFEITSRSDGYAQAAVAAFGGVFYALSANASNNWINTGTAGSFTTNTWYHLAYVRNGNTFTLYLNGTSLITYSYSGALRSFVSASDINVIGSQAGGANAVNGYISNFRVIKGTALYTSNFTPSNQPLTAVSGTQLLTCQSATIVDNSPNAFTISVYGNAAAVSSKTITRTGNVAQGTFSPFSLADGQWSNYFDGSGDSVYAPDSSVIDLSSSEFTIETFVNFSNTTSCYICGQAYISSGAGSYMLWTSGGYIRFYCTTDGTTATRVDLIDSGTYSTNTWNHIAVCRSGNTLSLFVNGSRKATTTFSGTMYNDSNPFYVAAVAGVASYLTGYVSNLRVVKGSSVYDATSSTLTVPTSSLTAITNTSLLTCQSNRFKDNSSNNFTITPSGDTKVTAFSPFAPSAAYSASTNGGSAYFDGTGDYLTTPTGVSDFGTGDFTVEFWTNYASQTGVYDFVDARGASYSNQGFAVYTYNGSIYVTWSTNNHIITTAPAANVWNHIAVCRSSGVTKLYLNGVQTGSTPADTNNYGDYYVNIGQLAGGGSYYLSGYMSNVRIVKGTAVYTANFTPPTAPLTAVTNTQLLLSCTNAGIIDNAGKNDIETVGNAQISTSVKKYGTGSMYFDGTGDYLTLQPSVVLDGDFTLECWVYSTGNEADGYSQIFSSASPNSTQIGYSNSGALIFYAAAWVINQVGTAVTQNAWHHVAFSRSGSTVRGFVDGVLIGSGTLASTTAVTVTRIGAFVSGGYEVNGYLDDLRITKGQALYTSNFTPPTSALPNV